MTDRAVTPRTIFAASIVNASAWLAFNYAIIIWVHRGIFSTIKKSSYNLFSLDSILRIPPLETLSFVSAVIVSYLLFACLVFTVAWPLVRQQSLFRARLWLHMIGLLMGLGAITLNNQLFPHSTYGLNNTSETLMFGTSLPLQSLFVMCIVALVIINASFYWVRSGFNLPTKRMLFTASALIFITGMLTWPTQPATSNSSPNRPNIILLGIDSLRTDVLESTSPLHTPMPTLKTWLEQAVSFQNVLTPMARTYPAWMSLLTGSNPTQHGMRNNLQSRETLDIQTLLNNRLKAMGYQSYYASDERRFSPIDHRAGFDLSTGPITGASDFLFGPLVDTPMTNLLLISPIGQYLFPHSYGNRAVAHSYEPQHFLNLVEDDLKKLDPNQPAFIAIHLCLPHWPYWNRTSTATDRIDLYQKSLKDSDEMLDSILSRLKTMRRLDNAIVILFSDHGEGFPELYSQSNKQIPLHSFGHGTNVFDNDQYRVMLGIQYYKEGKTTYLPKQVFAPVSLIDLYPTLSEIVGLPVPSNIEGWNLVPLLETDSPLPKAWQRRTRYIETGLTTQGLTTSETILDRDKLIKEGMGFYLVNDNGQLESRKEFIAELMMNKERAAQIGHWTLALRDIQTGFELFSSKTKTLAPFNEGNPEHRKLRQDFCNHFQKDIELYLSDFTGCNYDELVAGRSDQSPTQP